MKTKLFFILGIIFLCGCGPNLKNPESVASYLNGKTYYRIMDNLSICEIIEFKGGNQCSITQYTFLFIDTPIKETMPFEVYSIDPNSMMGTIAGAYVAIKFKYKVVYFETLLIDADGGIISLGDGGGVFIKTDKSPNEIQKVYKTTIAEAFKYLNKK